jgi:DNA segregation ATPase FtsK/SpoIIIE, S-DNA-T family
MKRLDERWEDALRLVAETKQASISMVQRRLRIGYNRAARIIEMMEREGMIAPVTAPASLGKSIWISSTPI